MGSSKSDLLQGTLDMLILQIAALGPVHGYAIAQRLQQISKDALQVQQGSLYPALHRLERAGLIASDWQKRSAPARPRPWSRSRSPTPRWSRATARRGT